MKLKFQFAAFATLFTALAFFPGQINSDLNSDKQALLEFAKSVPHLRKLNWNSKSSICKSWIGISCTKNKTRVLEIHLPAFGLYGTIPSNTIGKLDNLRVLSLHSNNLYGYLPSDVLSTPSLKSVYLQNNNFSGVIPPYLSPQITVLDLSYNALTGEVPPIFKNLTGLSVLKLQFNSLHGSVPNLDLPSLKLLNISYNFLNGSIPNSLENFPLSSFIGNSDLCGSPLILCSASSPSPAPAVLHAKTAPSPRKLKKGAITAISIGGGSILILLLLAIFFRCLKKKDSTAPNLFKPAKASSIKKNENIKSDDFGSGVQEPEKNKLVFFEGCSYNFDLEDLLRASAEVLGKGSYGTAYKAILDESTTVVVKRIKEVAVGKKEFEQHMETVNKLGIHPNVLPLLAYYYSKDEKLLVHEYMVCSSLSAALHGHTGTGRSPLDWDSRLNISLGAAKGISHIHSQGGTKFTHGNIKSSNILLTENLDPYISDFALTPLINHNSVKYRVAGYRAPEVIESQKISQKSDVYSFGVLLLEILTGKSPLQVSGYNDVVDLPRWVRSVVREEWTAEVFDVELMKYQNIEEELVQMLQIALTCVTKVPEMRPNMDEVVKMIRDIRNPEGENRLSSEDNASKDSNYQTP